MSPEELATLKDEALKNAFIAHFKPWALTVSCLEHLKEVSTKIIGIKNNTKLCFIFKNNEGDEVAINFGAPYKGEFLDEPFKIPASYKTVVRMHNTIRFDDGKYYEDIDFYGYDGDEPSSEFMLEELEGDETRHQGFCNDGQDWIIWDHQRQNALGEPVIMMINHGIIVEDNDDFPEQKEIAFGTGGFLIRMMKKFVV